ncbi:MAG: TetR/AcrR family transcriptional regulator [Pseudooceanicola sp.]|nr:TetR/AcrR family transcriptional regulator [Pseudooceanicola sp.]
MNMPIDDPRQEAILGAAWQCFAAYGFRKTTMDDIARGAGMSRPALYQHYRSKEDIFRRLAQLFYDEAAAGLARALSGSGDPPAALQAAFLAQGGRIAEAMLGSPHGMELLDTSKATAGDIAETGEARLRLIYADWLETGRAEGRLTFEGDAGALASTITRALKGMKSDCIDFDTYKASLAQLARVMGRGLSAG